MPKCGWEWSEGTASQQAQLHAALLAQNPRAGFRSAYYEVGKLERLFGSAHRTGGQDDGERRPPVRCWGRGTAATGRSCLDFVDVWKRC